MLDLDWPEKVDSADISKPSILPPKGKKSTPLLTMLEPSATMLEPSVTMLVAVPSSRPETLPDTEDTGGARVGSFATTKGISGDESPWSLMSPTHAA